MGPANAGPRFRVKCACARGALAPGVCRVGWGRVATEPAGGEARLRGGACFLKSWYGFVGCWDFVAGVKMASHGAPAFEVRLHAARQTLPLHTCGSCGLLRASMPGAFTVGIDWYEIPWLRGGRKKGGAKVQSVSSWYRYGPRCQMRDEKRGLLI